MKTVDVLIKQAQDQMYKAGKDEHLVDVIWLMSEVSGRSRTDLSLDGGFELTREQVVLFESYMARRLAGEPLQYILGNQPFYGYEFYVAPSVLIPRFETELLVEKAVAHSKEVGARTFIDMCTGSGCIGITLAKECPWMQGTLVDLSEKALNVADRNCRELQVADRVRLVHSNLFEALDDRQVDMILSNPPYIVSKVIPTLEEEVKCSEPEMALDGGEDGLMFYRQIAKEAKKYLNDNGYLIFEIGYDQDTAVQSILRAEGYEAVEGYKDLSGKDRMVKGSLRHV